MDTGIYAEAKTDGSQNDTKAENIENEQTEPVSKKVGCGATVASTTALLVGALGGAVISFKKKKED